MHFFFIDGHPSYLGGGFWEREEIPADKESIGYFRIVADQNNVRFLFRYLVL